MVGSIMPQSEPELLRYFVRGDPADRTKKHPQPMMTLVLGFGC